MKKILLSTTAIGFFAAGSALAEGPTVTVGGYADFQVGSANQEDLYTSVNIDENSSYSRDLHTRTDTELHINVDGKTDSGLGYGAYIELEADVSSDDNTSNDENSERTYIYVESGFGRVEAGATGDAGDALRVDAGTIARATGGISGDFYHYVDLTGSAAAASVDYYILPGLPSAVGVLGEAADTAITNRATANKISYYSPRVQGLQLGVSFTPDQDERGTAVNFSSDANEFGVENIWNAGLNYQTQVSDVTIEAALTGEVGDAKDRVNPALTFDGLEAVALGLSAGYQGFTLAGSYGSIDEINTDPTDNTEVSYWTLGGAYEFGPFATSVTYLSSEVENFDGTNNAEFTNLSVGADYQLAPGLVPYAEVSFFDTDDNVENAVGVTEDNQGTVFLVGTQLSF